MLFFRSTLHTAWEDRWNALKVFIENNQDEIEKWIFLEEDSDNDSDEEEVSI